MRTPGTYPGRPRISALLRRLTPVVCALALGGCLEVGGDGSDASFRVRGDTLTVYASLPRHGVSARAAVAVAAGQRQALSDAGGRVGRRRVRLVQLDSTRPGDRVWDPGRVNANAERAAEDPTTIAYLGELDYGGSAVSVPVTNDERILQVSPGDGLTSLTLSPPGAPRGAPDRYYPAGVRTFMRLVPSDLLEVETLLAEARAAGSGRLAIVSGKGVYGQELGEQAAALARRDGPDPVVAEELRPERDDARDPVRKLAEERPDAVLLTGVPAPSSGPFLAQLGRALPGVTVYASEGILAASELPPGVTVDALTGVLPGRDQTARGRRILATIRRREGPTAAAPGALYGYESMRVVLDAIERAGADRAGVARAALEVRTRRSVIGSYTVRATGDVGVERFARYRLAGGRFRYIGIAR
jgi:branched-chain amino acid transport system substrate-binding protein